MTVRIFLKRGRGVALGFQDAQSDLSTIPLVAGFVLGIAFLDYYFSVVGQAGLGYIAISGVHIHHIFIGLALVFLVMIRSHVRIIADFFNYFQRLKIPLADLTVGFGMALVMDEVVRLLFLGDPLCPIYNCPPGTQEMIHIPILALKLAVLFLLRFLLAS